MEQEFETGAQGQPAQTQPLLTQQQEFPGVKTAPAGYYTFIPFGFTPKSFEEKLSIKRSAKMIGLSLLIFMGISLAWSVVYLFVAKLLGLEYNQALEMMKEPAILQVIQIAVSILLFTVPFLLVFKGFGQRISELVPLQKPKKGLILPMFFLGIAFCGFANIAVSVLQEFFSSLGIHYSVDYPASPTGRFGFILSLLSTVITPALVEEFACRGLIMGSLRKYGDGFAIMVSSILFGLLHGNFEQMPFAFLVGLVLGFIAVETGSLWVGVAVHGFNNLVSVVFEYFLNNLSGATQNLIYGAFLMVSLLLGFVGLLLVKDQNHGFRFQKAQTESSEKQKYKWFFSSVPVLIFSILCILESLIYF